MLNHASGIRLQTAHGTPYVPVDLDDFLDAAGLQQRRRNALMNSQYHAIGSSDLQRLVSWSPWQSHVCAYPDGSSAELYSLERIFDLEETAFGGEGARRA